MDPHAANVTPHTAPGPGAGTARGDARQRTQVIDLSLILPAYNEAAIIAASVGRVDAYLLELGRRYEILVGDDGSTDGTAERASALGLSTVRVITHPHVGKGGILSACVLEATGEYIGFLDCDLEIDVGYVAEMLALLDAGHDVVIASKTLHPDHAHTRRLVRRIPTAAYNHLVRWLLGSRVSDHQAGLKVFRGASLRAIVPRVRNTGWLWDTEVLLACQRDKLRVGEIPVTTRPRPDSKVKVVSTSWRMLRDLIALARAARHP